VANAAYQKLRGRPSRRLDVSLDEVLPLFDESGRHIAPAGRLVARVEDPRIQVELRTALTAAIDELPAHLPMVLVLRDVEGHIERRDRGRARSHHRGREDARASRSASSSASA
jgi:DNA-directed RNA polymerase specialized sigma24 family protein